VTGSAVAQQVMTQLNNIKLDLATLSEEEDQYIGVLEDRIHDLEQQLNQIKAAEKKE